MTQLQTITQHSEFKKSFPDLEFSDDKEGERACGWYEWEGDSVREKNGKM